MPTLRLTTRSGEDHSVSAQLGLSVMEIIRDAGFYELEARCGGSMSCATCHVYVDEAGPQPGNERSDDEDDMLDGSDHRQSNSRLSCQIPFEPSLDGLHVTIAPAD